MNKTRETKLIMENWGKFLNESASRLPIFDSLPSVYKNELNVKDHQDGGAWMIGSEFVAEFIDMAVDPPSFTQQQASDFYNNLFDELAQATGKSLDQMICGDENSPDNVDQQHYQLSSTTFDNLDVNMTPGEWEIGWWECNGEKVEGATTLIRLRGPGGLFRLLVILPDTQNTNNNVDEPINNPRFKSKLGGAWS